MESVQQSYNEAANWIERGRMDAAQAAINRGMQIDPSHEGLRYLQAVVLFRDDAHSEALDAVEDLLQDAPELHEARLLHARLLREDGRLAESERELLELLREAPEDAVLMAHYAMTVLRAGQFDKADALVREAVRREPENHFVLFVAALCDMAQGRPVADSRAFEDMLRLEPDAESTLRTMAVALYREHKLGPAQELVQLLVRQSPHDRSVVNLAAAIRFENHWSMRPLYPVMRWGWNASIGIYVAVMVLLQLGRGILPPPLIVALSIAWISWAVYSWVWPPILKRWRFRELL